MTAQPRLLQSLLALALIGAAFMLPVAPAHAQNLDLGNLLANPPKDPEAEAKREKIDEAYRNAQKKNNPAAQQTTDPWGSIRAPEPAKPAAKPAAKSAGAAKKQSDVK